MEIKRILWPTDLSEAASLALPYVRSLAEKYGATVVVLHVHDELTRFDRLAKALKNDEAARVREQVKSETHDALTNICQTLGDACPLYEKQIRMGEPAEEILKFVEKENIDLVIMATHGYGGIKRFAYGSVADRVVQNSPAPVFTVRGK